MTTFANQINQGPVSLAHLDVIQLQANQFRPAKATAEQHGQHRVVALRTHALAKGIPEHGGTLLDAQPVASAKAELFHSSHPANPGSQLGTQQAGIGGLVGQATHGSELLIDGVGGQMPRFQVHAVAHDHDAVEGQARLGAIPGDELVDGIRSTLFRHSDKLWIR